MTADRAAAGGRESTTWIATALLVVSGAPLLAACAPKPVEPLHVPARSERAPIHSVLLIRAPRPDVTFPDLVPDLDEEPRWPLTGMQHPSLQPSFDVADALAEPGITWTDLCARNVDRRRDPAHRDELVYLAGWCAAERHDTTAAVGLLGQVRDSAVPGIARAVGFDIANILVDTQDEEHADRILVQAQLRSVELYDLLAAAYFEIGRNDDAVQATAAALQLDVRYGTAATCHRLARAALLGPEASRGMLVSELTNASKRKTPDPACVALAAEVSCAVDPQVGCESYRSMHSIDPMLFELARIDEHWNRARSWRDWLDLARDIRMDLLRPQANAMWTGAVDAAVVGTECEGLALQGIANTVDGWTSTPGFESVRTKATWAAALWQQPAECVRFRDQWLRDHPQ